MQNLTNKDKVLTELRKQCNFSIKWFASELRTTMKRIRLIEAGKTEVNDLEWGRATSLYFLTIQSILKELHLQETGNDKR